jgi:hypothetical protein
MKSSLEKQQKFSLVVSLASSTLAWAQKRVAACRLGACGGDWCSNTTHRSKILEIFSQFHKL